MMSKSYSPVVCFALMALLTVILPFSGTCSSDKDKKLNNKSQSNAREVQDIKEIPLKAKAPEVFVSPENSNFEKTTNSTGKTIYKREKMVGNLKVTEVYTPQN